MSNRSTGCLLFLCVGATAVLGILRLLSVIDWSWWYVTAPLTVTIAALLIDLAVTWLEKLVDGPT